MNTQTSIGISAVVLGVKDLNRAKKFYSEGLGCTIDQDHRGFVSLKLGDGSPKLGLYTRDSLAADAGVDAEGSGFRGVTFSCFLPTTEGVDEVLAKAERAGGKIVKSGQKAQWGGYSGHFSDPDGYLWKVVVEA